MTYGAVERLHIIAFGLSLLKADVSFLAARQAHREQERVWCNHLLGLIKIFQKAAEETTSSKYRTR
ncbi:hypothetical protein SAMN05421882_10905 [Nitrosomonas communis]|uniref:Uncharacterized protein n=1 Tax=Nitrosomonas communis TaxID=44574 RepID=A0A1H2ZSA0_9PROT|nr:hypothetical protein SAMN05421882_10905 [Nitrosomonas communis]